MSGAAAPRRQRRGGNDRARRPRIGLALAGGGPLGGIYEVGALLALSDSLDGLDFDDLDVYVGVSSGGFVAAALANGISPAQMYRLFIDDGADAALTPELFLRPAFARVRRRLARRCRGSPRARRCSTCAIRSTAASWSRSPTLARAMPTGVFDNRAIDAFLRGCSRHRDAPTISAQLAPQAVPGRDQPRHRRLGDLRRAGARPRADLARDRGVERAAGPVSAGRASTASTTSTARSTRRCTRRSRSTKACTCCCASIRSCRSTPARARATAVASVEKLNQGGLPLVLCADVSRDHPFADEGRHGKVPRASIRTPTSLLFEPDREDADMFFASIFSYAQRKRLCAPAYRKHAAATCCARAPMLAPQLARTASRLRHERLADARALDRRRAHRSAPARSNATARACGRRRAISRTRSIIWSAWLAAASAT